MHLSMFSGTGVGDGITIGNWTIFKPWGLIPYSCDTILCQKSPGHDFQFRHNFFEIFYLRHLTSASVPKSSVKFLRVVTVLAV